MSDRKQARDDDLDRRDRSGEDRDDAGTERDDAGTERDDAGVERDRAGVGRDAAAERRDQTAEDFEAQHPLRSSGVFTHSTLARAEAAADREGAAEDRRAGATERDEAGLDRKSAHADRDASARDREAASFDSLTGLMARGVGLLALDREVARAKRSQDALLVGFVDVDHLKRVNDSRGHHAGDQVLIEVAHALRNSSRAYDLLFRYGGDEFACAFPSVPADFGAAWLARVNSELVSGGQPKVSAGFAELRPEDDGAQLLERADAALYRTRGLDRSSIADGSTAAEELA